jgi:imidazolonepropionase-like amidohydrolase
MVTTLMRGIMYIAAVVDMLQQNTSKVIGRRITVQLTTDVTGNNRRNLTGTRFRFHCVLLLMGFMAIAAGAETRDSDADKAPFDGNSFVVRNVRVFDGERVLERTNVIIRNGRISSIGRGRPPAGLAVVDGSGRTLLPGLIDAHAHVLSETGLRNSLRFGVTTQLDMFTKLDFMQSHRAQRERLNQTDFSDLYSAGQPVTSAGGMGTQFGIPFPTITGPQEASAFVRARLNEGSDYIKILYEPEAGIVTTISPQTLRAVVAAAHAQGAMAVVHVTSLKGAREAVAAGADGLAHIFGDELIDEALAGKMAARGMFVTPTLSLFAAISGVGLGPELAADPRISPYLTANQLAALTGPPPGKGGGPMASYLSRFNIKTASENVRRLRAAGVRILAGTDTPNLAAHGVSLHGELLLLTRAGLTPAEALKAATRAPAEAFKLANRGRIIPGARADLVLVDGNPLADIKATRAIARIFKNGYDVRRTPVETAQPNTP